MACEQAVGPPGARSLHPLSVDNPAGCNTSPPLRQRPVGAVAVMVQPSPEATASPPGLDCWPVDRPSRRPFPRPVVIQECGCGPGWHRPSGIPPDRFKSRRTINAPAVSKPLHPPPLPILDVIGGDLTSRFPYRLPFRLIRLGRFGSQSAFHRIMAWRNRGADIGQARLSGIRWPSPATRRIGILSPV